MGDWEDRAFPPLLTLPIVFIMLLRPIHLAKTFRASALGSSDAFAAQSCTAEMLKPRPLTSPLPPPHTHRC